MEALLKSLSQRLLQLSVFSLLIFTVSCNLDPLGSDDTFSMTLPDDFKAMQGKEVEVSPTVIYNGEETLRYTWNLESKPSTSDYEITDRFSETLYFSESVLGEYKFSLILEEDGGEALESDITITVVKEPIYLSGSVSEPTTLVDVYDDPASADYRVSGTYRVNAELTIDPNVIIEFEDGAGMMVTDDGSIIAVGTEQEPILFTGVVKDPGYYRGITINSKNLQNELQYVTIEYGGSSGFDGLNIQSNLTLHSGKVKIQNSQFTHSENYGIYLRSTSDELVDFSENIISDNKAPVMMSANTYHFLDGSNDFSGNTYDYIDSYKGNPTDEDAEWKSLNVPYRISQHNIIVESDITIAAGARFLGQSNSGIQVTSNGSLRAVGTSSEPINFYGEEDLKGYWKGISISSNTTKNVLDYVAISNGGEAGFDGANLKANLMIQSGGRVSIKNSLFTDSGDYGIVLRHIDTYLDEFSNNVMTDNSVPILTKIHHFHYFDNSNDYTGNTDDVILTTWANEGTALDVEWDQTEVPFVIEKIEYLESDITIAAGVEIIGLESSGLIVRNGGTITTNGTSTDPVIIRGMEDVPSYWTPLRIFSNSLNNRIDHTIISNGGEIAVYNANIYLGEDAYLNLSNSELRNSSGYGVKINSYGATFIDNNNTYINCQLGQVDNP